jgi:site-specific DNA-cytosine methylase
VGRRRFAEQAIIAGHPLRRSSSRTSSTRSSGAPNDDGGLFNAWLTAIDALGYEHEIVWLNSMFAPPAPDPAPQSRDRMYVVFWRKGRRAPNLRVEPPAWCPHCERLVAGQQTWKRPDRGRGAATARSTSTAARTATARAARRVPGDLDHRPDLPAPSDRRAREAAGAEHARAHPPRPRAPRARAVRDPPHARRRAAPLTLPLVTLTQRHDGRR